MTISVVINTYNSALLLPKVLETVSDFDEIIVCDMESTDDTVEIARKHGAKVVTFPKGNYNHCEPARNFAISQANNEWVLVVDSDELVTEDLHDYLYKFTAKAEKDLSLKGLYIPRKNYFIDRFRKSRYPDYKLRFFSKDSVYWPPEIHSIPEINGKVSKIPSNKKNLALIHIPRTLTEMLNRINRVSSVEMEERKNQKVTPFHILLVPTWTFFNRYFLKGAFRCGMPGFIQTVNNTIEDFYRLAKIYEAGKVEQLTGLKIIEDVPASAVIENLTKLDNR